MTTVRLYTIPAGRTAEVFEVPSVAEWLLSHYGEAAPQVGIQVFKGQPADEADITTDIDALIASDAPEYVVLQRPGGPALPFIQAIIMIYSVYTALNAQSPSMPPNVNRTQQSPNNALGSRENQVRVGQRVEDIFGTVKAIPSLMMPTYNKYIDNDKYEYGYYCISRGYVDAAEISDGDSLLANITGSSAAVYWPFTSPNSGTPVIQIGAPIIDKVLTVARSNEVDGITLRPLNELLFADGQLYDFEPTSGGDIIRQRRKAPNFNSLIEPGDEITVVMSNRSYSITSTVEGNNSLGGFLGSFVGESGGDGGVGTNILTDFEVGDVITVVSVGSPTNNGTYTITSISDTKLGVSPAPADSSAASTTFSVIRNYSDTYTVDGVADGFIVLATETFPQRVVGQAANIAIVTDDPVTEWTDYTTLPDPERTEVWVNIVAPQGLNKDNGGMSEVTVEFEIEIGQLNPGTLLPTGTVESFTSTLTGSVTDERADTVEHATAWTGPARVRMRRTSQHDFDFGGRVTDEIKWADLYSVTPTGRSHFGNKTTIHTITQATARSTAVKTRQLNCIASRRIPTYNGSIMSGAFNAEGRHVSGTISQTSRLVDIIAAVAADRKIGDRDLSADIDLPQIYAVQQQLNAWHAEVGQFNYTFDTDNFSFEETVLSVANAGFCTAYRQSGKIRLALDRLQPNSTAIFTHRNKQPKAETITRKFANDGDYDGVEFTYTDPDSNQQETIKLPLDGSARVPKKFEIPGIRSFAQAWFRANREYNKIFGQRITIETGTTMDARALLPNTRIDVVDNTRFKSFDGEVVGQSGLVLTLSQPVEFSPGEKHSIVLMRRDGSVQGIPVSAGATSQNVILQYAPTEALVTSPDPDAGIRTIFSFASDSQRAAMAYIVTELDLSDGQYAKVKGVNYSPDYYRADLLPVPDKAGIIN